MDLRLTLDAETQFMLLEPGERVQTVDSLRASLEAMLAGNAGAVIVAEHEDRLVGYISAEQGTFRRNRHGAYIVTGLRQAYCDKGIGRRLFLLN